MTRSRARTFSRTVQSILTFRFTVSTNSRAILTSVGSAKRRTLLMLDGENHMEARNSQAPDSVGVTDRMGRGSAKRTVSCSLTYPVIVRACRLCVGRLDMPTTAPVHPAFLAVLAHFTPSFRIWQASAILYIWLLSTMSLKTRRKGFRRSRWSDG